jgi:hypothetical protein
MLTLSYGYKKPQAGDRGSVWFPAMEENIQKLNDHNHDGVNTAAISGSNIASANVIALAANWGAEVRPGVYRQLMSMPSGFSFDNCIAQVKLHTSGHIVNLTVERVSGSSFYLYTCDNTESYKVYFK